MRIQVNGESEEVRDDVSLSGLLESLGVNPNGIAVALNMEVVPRGKYGETPLREGDEVEIVRAVGGG